MYNMTPTHTHIAQWCLKFKIQMCINNSVLCTMCIVLDTYFSLLVVFLFPPSPFFSTSACHTPKISQRDAKLKILVNQQQQQQLQIVVLFVHCCGCCACVGVCACCLLCGLRFSQRLSHTSLILFRFSFCMPHWAVIMAADTCSCICQIHTTSGFTFVFLFCLLLLLLLSVATLYAALETETEIEIENLPRVKRRNCSHFVSVRYI